MCLYPRLIKNRKYTQNKKNGGIIPTVSDDRVLYVPVACQMCIECRKKKARDWSIRLQEEIKVNTNGKFIVLTFSNESIKAIDKEIPEQVTKKRLNWEGIEIEKEKNIVGYTRDNAIATWAVRHFLERWRKKYKKSVRHWLITELGHNGTENIHLHGIIWTDESYDAIETIWNYGWIWPRKEFTRKGIAIRRHTWVNGKSVSYMMKYVSKVDKDHKCYIPIILTSAGIGGNYRTSINAKKNKYTENNTNETYRTGTGHKISLPIYYRNDIYTEEEREKLWLEKLNKEERYILGSKISIKNNNMDNYYKVLKSAQKTNKELGYSDPKTAWKREKYEQERRQLMLSKRKE